MANRYIRNNITGRPTDTENERMRGERDTNEEPEWKRQSCVAYEGVLIAWRVEMRIIRIWWSVCPWYFCWGMLAFRRNVSSF